MIQIFINEAESQAAAGDRLIDAINRAGVPVPQVCYHPQLGPIQTCRHALAVTLDLLESVGKAL
jgi:formate dehydrogenase major subunit